MAKVASIFLQVLCLAKAACRINAIRNTPISHKSQIYAGIFKLSWTTKVPDVMLFISQINTNNNLFKGHQMKKSFFAGVLFFMAYCCVCMATDDNQEFKAEVSLSYKLSDAWKIKANQVFHFRDGEHCEHENIVSFAYAGLAEWLELGVGFKQAHTDSNNRWLRENRPFGDITFKKTIFGIEWSDRNRLEYRDFEGSPDAIRYRNRIKAHIPYDIFDLPVQPYTAYEVLVQEERGDYQSRVYGGLVWDVSENVDLDFYVYHKKSDTSTGRDNRYIIGFVTRFSF